LSFVFFSGGPAGLCDVEIGELDAVAVDLAQVEVLAHFGYVLLRDVVCGAPDALVGEGLVVVG
jgi:hypothetical protein